MQTCQYCNHEFSCQRDLDRHLTKKYSCKNAPFRCQKCKRPSWNKSSHYHHQKHCEGKAQTTEEKDDEIKNLKDALAAASGLNTEIESKRQREAQQIINNNNTNNISIDQINNVTQNIIILNCGQENIEHFRKLSLQQLREKIGLDKNPSTHIEAYKLIHLDPEHPENHNLLLTDRDSDKVTFYGNNEWKNGSFAEQMRLAVFDVNRAIQRTIPEKQRDEFYWNHLEHGIATKCNNKDDKALRPIFEGLRDPLHKSTMRLMGLHSPDLPNDHVEEEIIHSGESTANIKIEMEREKTRRLEIQAQERTKEIEAHERMKKIEALERTKQSEERTKQLQLELELAKLQASHS